MPEVPDTVDDALDALSSPSTDDVEDATRSFSSREIGSSAASRAMGAGGGGGSQPLSHTAELTSADILALNATTYDGPALTPAPAVGQMIVPLSQLTIAHAGPTPYTGDSEVYLSTAAEYGTGNGGSWWQMARKCGIVSFVAPNEPAVLHGPSLLDDDVSLVGVDSQPLGLFVNAPFVDGDGTLTVKTRYEVYDLS